MNWLLGLDVIDGPLPYIAWGLAAVLVIVLLLPPYRNRRLPRSVLGAVIGAVVGLAVMWLSPLLQITDVAFPAPVWFWIPATFAACGLAIANLWKSRLWQKIVAVLVIVVAVLAGVLGVNAAFGIDRTVGAMMGLSTAEQLDGLPQPAPSQTLSGPLYESWTPPADMPSKGKVGLLSGDQAIPSSAGFKPRDASVYLPPAAQVEGRPPLPLVVMMMGMPGNPDPTFIAETMDALAAKNKGLAPIVIVADQLGDPNQDPVCVNSQRFGGVETYFNKDVVDYAKSKLGVIDDPKYWTIAGYSNGGACAFSYIATHPEIWGNVVSISGDQFPGMESQDATLRDVFGGDQQAFDANRPESRLAGDPSRFADHVAVFTVGSEDQMFMPGAQANAKLAQDTGFTTTYYVVPGAGHTGDGLSGGLAHAFEVLYPHLGLAPQ